MALCAVVSAAMAYTPYAIAVTDEYKGVMMETGDKVELKFGTTVHNLKVLVNDQNVPRVRGVKLESHVDNMFTLLTVEVIKMPVDGAYETDTYHGVFVSLEDWKEFQAWRLGN